MDVTTQQTIDTVQTVAPQNSDPGSAISSEFETFLKMLTVQMENQDPLNPIESADFAVQLATFSGVEQQVRTNELLSDLSSTFSGDVLGQYAGWVGLSAASNAPANFDGTPIPLELSPAPNAGSAVLEVRDQSGRVVETREVAAQTSSLQWSGIAADGQQFLDGLYSFSLKSFSGPDLISETPVDVYQRVVEARLVDGAAEIVFEGGGTAPADAVRALRQP